MATLLEEPNLDHPGGRGYQVAVALDQTEGVIVKERE